MWVASFLRLILASRYQVGVWPIEVFPHSQTHDLAKDLAISQDLRKVAKVPESGVLRGQNLLKKCAESCQNRVILVVSDPLKTGRLLAREKSDILEGSQPRS